MCSAEGAISDRAVADWAPGERESFFRAIHRHRRAAWRVRAVSVLANYSVAIIVAVLMAPLFYAAICLLFDLINLVIPMPNLVSVIGSLYGKAASHPGHVQWWRPVMFILAVALPGLLWMLAITRMLSRSLAVASENSVWLGARCADRSVLSEQRFTNVIEEMAIAAGLPAPGVLITQREILNAAVYGGSERSADIIVSESLLATLNRQEMQAIAADLMGAIADGDPSIGQHIAVTVGLFGVTARFSKVLNADDGFRQLWRLLEALWNPSPERSWLLIQQISDPYVRDGRRGRSRSDAAPVSTAGETPTPGPRKKSNWRLWLWMPLAGPVVMSGFFAGFVSTFVLRPLMALAWRQRKYMADAVAVRLTRDPDALASALARIGSGPSFSPLLAHLSVVSAHTRGELLGSSVVPMIPSLERRLRALRKMGANVRPHARRPVDWRAIVLLPPLVVLFVVLMALLMVLMCYASIPMSALFTGVPFAVLHLLLRALGH
jgi:Zn-dependent protease with chaperone function